MTSFTYPLPDLAATEALARRFADLAKQGDVIALEGELGAGKTAFARAFLKALDVTGEVPSPTFSLLQIYDTPKGAVHHFDLYRLKQAVELDELGWIEALSSGIVLVEWPDRAGSRLPDENLTLRFNMKDSTRFAEILPHGGWARRVRDTA